MVLRMKKYYPEKTVYMLFNSQNRVKNISEIANQLELDGQQIKQVSQFKYLGCQISDDDKNILNLNYRKKLTIISVNK